MDKARKLLFGLMTLAVIFMLIGCSNGISSAASLKRRSNNGIPDPEILPPTDTINVPAGQNAALQPSGSVRISWNPVPGAIKYRIYFGEEGSHKLDYVAEVPGTENSYTDEDDFIPKGSYHYQVTAINNNGESPRAPIISVQFPSTTTPPEHVSNPFLGTWIRYYYYDYDGSQHSVIYTLTFYESTFDYHENGFSGTYTYSGNKATMYCKDQKGNSWVEYGEIIDAKTLKVSHAGFDLLYSRH
jgi:hypothetical protein